jgi:hypothetical protein
MPVQGHVLSQPQPTIPKETPTLTGTSLSERFGGAMKQKTVPFFKPKKKL